MLKDGRVLSPARRLAFAEIKGEKRDNLVELVLLTVTLVSVSSLLILLTSHFLATGYSTYISSQAGYITEVTITKQFPSTFWNGIYGIALRVPGFTEQLYTDMNNEISRQDLFFDCINPDAAGGINEIYASNVSSLDFSNMTPASLAEIDAYMGCGTRSDCASNTFTSHNMSIMLGSTNITNIPATYSYRYDGLNDVFEIGALKDASGNFVFVTVISGFQKGYSVNVTVNYQMLLPTPENTTVRYYYFTDPFEVCPEGGGIGEVISANVSGYVMDSNGSLLSNATVTFAGVQYTTNASGYYVISVNVTEGNYSLIGQKTGYDDVFYTIPINFNVSFGIQNITLVTVTPGLNTSFISHVHGYITDSLGIPIFGAEVSLSGTYDTTDIFGYYSLYASLFPTNNTLLALMDGYNHNYSKIDFSSQPSDVEKNLSLTEITATVVEKPFDTGPYTQQLISNIREVVEKNGEDYWVSTKEVDVEVRQNTFMEQKVAIFNFGDPMELRFSLSPELTDIVSLSQTSLSVASDSLGELGLTIYGTSPLGTYTGNLTISGSLEQKIPIRVKIVERRMPIETLLMRVDLFSESVRKGDVLKYRLSLQNLLSDQSYLVYLTARVRDINGSEIYASVKTTEEIASTLALLQEIGIPSLMENGEYYLDIEAKYLNLISRVKVPFRVTQPLYLYAFLGIPLWIYLVFISFVSFVLLNVFMYKRHLDKQKRYRVAIDYSTLPGPGERSIKMGHIAETSKDAYLELERLTVHTIVAGATGMGKSISAQVIIEEALAKGVCVIVFDPTAQWSGMLRKCEDKKMISFYPKFGLKPSDARGFPGNIRAVKDARQIIDINKYFEPGHIQIFTLNKLQPKEMDIFVANVIRQIFKSDPKESPVLKTLLVFDEVHRLLPRFGGSGEGFLQIERGCREFRKWGLGQILISQVMNDFVGEIKANINTEIQARTVEEGDLERIRSRYGEMYLKSLVKSEVGVSMFQNAEYNRGLPYFINFRPILHNTRRLADEELERYNQYNDIVDDLEYQIEQLEALKVDVFDVKMELKLVKGKIMTGNFAVVDIYLEGLTPRVSKQWEKLGKSPSKKVLELANLDEIQRSVLEAKKERAAQVQKDEAAKKKGEVVSPKADLENKILVALTFDNGAMISSLKELKELLPELDDEVFKIHVNEKKNDIAVWLEQVSKPLADKVRPIQDKSLLVKELKAFGAEEAPVGSSHKS